MNTIWSSMRDAFRELRANDPLRMAAATSFFASFALPPIMVILIEVFGLFGNPRAIRHGLFEQLGRATDQTIALQVRLILRNLHYLPLNRGMRIGGFIFLLFVATTLFEVIRNSLDQLWKIRLKERPGRVLLIMDRVRSLGIILMTGVLFCAVLLAESQAGLLPHRAVNLYFHAVTMLAGMCWFIIVFKYLSHARPAWRTAIAGGVFTGLLLAAGAVVLHSVLSYDNAQTIYGGSTAFVLLLLFIFYCSLMFYFGACFTAALADRTGQPFLLTRHAAKGS